MKLFDKIIHIVPKRDEDGKRKKFHNEELQIYSEELNLELY